MHSQPYFTAENIDTQVAELLEEIHPGGRLRGPEFEIQYAGLLVLDMQHYFLDPESHAFLSAAEPILPRIRKLVACFVDQKRPVIFTRHIDSAKAGNPMLDWWNGRIQGDNSDSRLALDDIPGECAVVEKSTYDAFQDSNLEKILLAARVKQVMVCGVLTHLCVETTARAAFTRGFNVFLPADATASNTRRHHQASLLNLSHGFARITTVDSVVNVDA